MDSDIVTTHQSRHGILIIPDDDNDDDEDIIPILGTRLVNDDSDDSDDERNPRVITIGKELQEQVK
jgi:hypothetical protein